MIFCFSWRIAITALASSRWAILSRFITSTKEQHLLWIRFLRSSHQNLLCSIQAWPCHGWSRTFWHLKCRIEKSPIFIWSWFTYQVKNVRYLMFVTKCLIFDPNLLSRIVNCLHWDLRSQIFAQKYFTTTRFILSEVIKTALSSTSVIRITSLRKELLLELVHYN